MRRVCSALLIFLALIPGAIATTVVPMSVERLTQASTHVVIGRSAESWTQWSPDHKLIFTLTKFQVARTLKGHASQTIIVKQMGGRLGAYEQKVAGVRQLQAGEQAVLFIHPSQSADGTMVVTGLMQGNFKILDGQGNEPVVWNGVAGADAFDPQQGTVQHYSGAHMPLSQLESIVHEALETSPK